MLVEVEIDSSISGNLENQTEIPILIYNIWYNKEEKKNYFFEEFSYIMNQTDLKTDFEATAREHTFNLIGSKKAYIYDAYMLNFTIRIFSRAELTKENTVIVFYSWPTDWQADYIPDFNISQNSHEIQIKCNIIIKSQSWEVGYFHYYFKLMLILIGSIHLLRTTHNKIRIHLMLLFPITVTLMTFSELTPPKTGTTISFYLLKFVLECILWQLVSDIIILFIDVSRIINKTSTRIIINFLKRYRFFARARFE